MSNPKQGTINPRKNSIEKMETKVEIATIENLKDIQGLNKILFDEEFAQYDQTINCDWTLSEEGKNHYKEKITGENNCAFVLKSENEVIGYLVGSLSDAEFYRNIESFAELDDMFVLKQFRNGGQGGKLYNAFIDWCETKGVKRIKVVASAKNAQAINFYRKKGFLDYSVTLEADLDKIKK